MTKAASAKSWPLNEWSDGTTRSWPEPEVPDSELAAQAAEIAVGVVAPQMWLRRYAA